MSERWLHLFRATSERLLESPHLLHDPYLLSQELQDEGYSAQEAELAIAWISRFLTEPFPSHLITLQPIVSRGLRARSAEEHYSFSTEAFGYLMRLEHRGFIDAATREEILERALETYEDEIGEDEIREVSRHVLEAQGLSVPDSAVDSLDQKKTSQGNRH